MIDPKAVTKMQVGALEECADLEANGYRKVFAHTSDRMWFLKLRHSKNGRTISVVWKPDGYYLQSDGLILKEVGNIF